MQQKTVVRRRFIKYDNITQWKCGKGKTVSTIPMLYEDASLTYTGLDKHEGEQIGGWDTVGSKEKAEMHLDRNFKGKKSNGG